MLSLLRHPDQLALFLGDPGIVPNAIEEILRYDPPVTQTNRVALQPIALDGSEIPPGILMSASLIAANHDPARHADPHRFDITRKDTSHLSFGGGAHFCLGAPLARAEAQIALPLLFERFPGLRLDPDRPIERKHVPVFKGLDALWVRTD